MSCECGHFIKLISTCIDAITINDILIILSNAYSDGIEQNYNANKSHIFNHYNMDLLPTYPIETINLL